MAASGYRGAQAPRKTLAEMLQKSIATGNLDQAINLARQLAEQKANLKVDVQGGGHERDRDEEIKVTVHIEDRTTSAGQVIVSLRPSMTVGDLKMKMLYEYGFAPEIQHWIIGKRLPGDIETLARCKVNVSGAAIFLYLVPFETAGLTREKFRQKYWHLIPDDLKQGEEGPDQSLEEENPYMDMGGGTPARNVPDPPVQTNMELRTPTPPRSPRPPPPPAEPVGWTCPACTYINVPTRPGCEICSTDRPAQYKVPDTYELPEEEKRRLEQEKQLEQLMREAGQAGPRAEEQGGFNLQLTEEDLNRLLVLNDFYHELETNDPRLSQVLPPAARPRSQSDSDNND